MKMLSVRVPDTLYATLKDQHAATYAKHRLSWNAWLVHELANVATKQQPQQPAKGG